MPSFISKTTQSADADHILWEPFSPARLSALLDEGKPVFIDFTADWCLTCKVNERVALGRSEVARAFYAKGVIALKADWTNSDASVTSALAGYGRSSIPLYVFYPAGSRDYAILPQVLTPSNVIGAMGP